MARPVEITLPEQASGQARAAIPEHAVPRVAAAMRAERGEQPDGNDDEEYIADVLLEEIRQRVQQHERSEAIRQAVRNVTPPEIDF